MNHTVVRAALRLAIALVVSLFGVVSMPSAARADVRLIGEWSGDDHAVTLDADGVSRARAIEMLAQAAGWSVVVDGASAGSGPLAERVDIHVKDQPATQVLQILLGEGDYVAKRTGGLVSVKPSAAAVAPSPPSPPPPMALAPPVPPVPVLAASGRGDDKTVFGGELTVAKDDVVHDVTVLGGEADIYGTVTGDLAALGGGVHVHDGAKVLGSASVIGGEMRVDDGAQVERNVGVIGGHVDHAGRSGHGSHEKSVKESRGFGSSVLAAIGRWFDDVLSALSGTALLFVFGSVVIALATERSRMMRVEVAARPMRTFALGVVAAVAAVMIFVALCITIIGIPVALVAGALFVVAACAGVTAVLTTVGEALLRHSTTSSYVHLALGCTLYFLAGLVPWVGSWLSMAVIITGMGVLVATRGAGFVMPKAPRRAAYGEAMA